MSRPSELVVAAVLALFLALCATLVSSLAVASTPPGRDPKFSLDLAHVHFPGPLGVEMWVAQRARPIGAVLLAGSLLALAASVELLRLRSWARPMLEGLAWFALAFILALRLLRTASRLFRLSDSAAEAALFIAFGVLGFLILAVPFAGLIYLLRRRVVREALASV
jgi:hypothetical protein